jgi:hypothetical protein
MLKVNTPSVLEEILSKIPDTNGQKMMPMRSVLVKTYYSEKPIAKKYPYGMLSNVFLNCEAFQRLGFIGKKRQLSHFEGNSLLSIVNKFEFGVERFVESMIGWGETESQIKQIEDYEKYPPCTCQKAQELGICNKSNPEACMKSVNGASPSPIRFATRPINPKKHLEDILNKYFGGEDE